MAENTDGNNLEQQLQEIPAQIEAKRQELAPASLEGATIPEKTLLHHVIGDKLEKETTPTHIQQTQPSVPTQTQQTDSETSAQQTAQHADESESYELPEMKDNVQQLVNLAFQKDIDTAVKEVKKQNDGALIDAFHDALVDELYDKLVQEGKLKEVS